MKPGMTTVCVIVMFESGTGGVKSNVIGRNAGRVHCGTGADVSGGASLRTT